MTEEIKIDKGKERKKERTKKERNREKTCVWTCIKKYVSLVFTYKTTY